MSPTVTYALQAGLGLVFLLSSVGKLRSVTEYFDQLREYRIVPDSLVQPVGMLIIATELALAMAHLLGRGLYLATRLSVLMLLVFTIVVGAMLRQERQVPCLCFGAKAGETVSRRALGRLLLLMGAEGWLCISLVAVPAVPAGLHAREVILCIAFASLALISMAWLFRLPELLPMAQRAFTRSSRHLRVREP